MRVSSVRQFPCCRPQDSADLLKVGGFSGGGDTRSGARECFRPSFPMLKRPAPFILPSVRPSGSIREGHHSFIVQHRHCRAALLPCPSCGWQSTSVQSPPACLPAWLPASGWRAQPPHFGHKSKVGKGETANKSHLGPNSFSGGIVDLGAGPPDRWTARAKDDLDRLGTSGHPGQTTEQRWSECGSADQLQHDQSIWPARMSPKSLRSGIGLPSLPPCRSHSVLTLERLSFS